MLQGVSFHNNPGGHIMKRLALVILAMVLASHVGYSRGAKFGIGLQGGASVSAFQDLIKDFYGVGFNVGAHFDIDIIPAFSTRFNVDYHSFSPDTDKLKDFIAFEVGIPASSIESISGGSINVISVTLNAIGKIPTRSSVVPYALFGVGIHNITLSDITGSAQGQSGSITADDIGFKEGTKFGLNFGVGSEFQMRSVVIFVQAGYTIVFTEDESNGAIPIIVGVTFGL
jgi:Outer membrane protein beta-barrel domain